MLRQCLLVWLTALMVSCSGKEEKIRPVITAITESVYASVTVQPDSLYRAYAVVNGILDEILVKEGDVVKKGDALFQITNTNPKLNTENARLALQLARENYRGSNTVLENIQKEIDAAKLKFRNDSTAYFRQKRLWEQRIGSEADYDARKLAYELSSNALKQLNTKYLQTNNELEIQMKQAENTYKASQVTTGDFRVTSKINGKVYAIHKEPGEIVTTTEPLADLGSEQHFVIVMLVDEVDIVKVVLDQQVIVSLDAYPGKPFSARVHKIYPKKEERNQTFRVEAVFEKGPEVLYPGLSGEGNIHIQTKKEALVVPKSFVVNDSVHTEEGKIKITTGLQTLDSIEIVSGISKETLIIKPKND